MKGLLLTAAALVCTAAPALARTTADGSFVAVDNAWRANDTDATTLTIAPGQTVTFGYPAGTTTHDAHFADRVPDCTGLPPGPRPKGWSATCTFPDAGQYPFYCDVHAGMQGTVVVAVPTPSPTPTAEPGTPVPTPTPVATPTPAPTQTSLALRLARHQKGSRVRGSVRVDMAGSRVEVTVRSGKAKAGTWVKKSAAAGRASFAIVLNARTRRALRAERRLALTVTIVLTPPGAKPLTTSAKATVSL
jgi:plastocyanin